MANISQTDLESLYTSIKASSNVSAGQIAQAQTLLYLLLKSIFGPAATSTTIGNGSV